MVRRPLCACVCVPCLDRVAVRTAMFLAAAGVLAFILESISLLLVLSAIYVIAFSLMLLMYELHWKSLEERCATARLPVCASPASRGANGLLALLARAALRPTSASCSAGVVA